MPKENKILRILKELPQEEFKRFQLFLQSPYFNKNKRLLTLLKNRHKVAQDLEKTHQQLFPKEPFNKQVFKNLLSKLMQLYKKFLAVEQIENEPLLRNLLTVEQEKSKGDKAISLAKVPTINHQENTSRNILAFHFIDKLLAKNLEISVSQERSNEEIAHQFNEKYLLQKEVQTIELLKTLTVYVQIKQKLPDFQKIDFLETTIKEFVIPKSLEESILLQLYYKTYRLLVESTDSSFKALNQLFNTTIKYLHSSHIQFIYTVLEMYCVQKINLREVQYEEELFFIMQTHLTLLKHESISDSMITNYVKIGCRCAKAALVSAYIEQHKKRISYNAYNHTKALIAFYSKKYKESLTILLNVTFTILDYQLTVRQLILTNLFLLQEYEAALNHIESFRIFLVRKKEIRVSTKKGTMNYLKFLKAAIHLEMDKSLLSRSKWQAQRMDLKAKIEACQVLLNKVFLLNIIDK